MKTIEHVVDLNTLWLESSLTLYTKWLPHFTTLACSYHKTLLTGWSKWLR